LKVLQIVPAQPGWTLVRIRLRNPSDQPSVAVPIACPVACFALVQDPASDPEDEDGQLVVPVAPDPDLDEDGGAHEMYPSSASRLHPRNGLEPVLVTEWCLVAPGHDLKDPAAHLARNYADAIEAIRGPGSSCLWADLSGCPQPRNAA